MRVRDLSLTDRAEIFCRGIAELCEALELDPADFVDLLGSIHRTATESLAEFEEAMAAETTRH